MKRAFLFLNFVFLGYLGFGQGTFESGCIITNDGDTICGEIREKLIRAKSSIKFRELDKEIIEYTPNDIKGYYLKSGNSYLSVQTPFGAGFGKIEVDGYLRLVYIEIYSEPGFIKSEYKSTKPVGDIRKTSGTFGSEKLYSNYKFFKNGEEVFYVSRSTFKGRTANFFSDYPELQNKIKKKKLKFADLKSIVKMYNDWYNKNLHSL